jgi:hypothetical protein
MCVVMLDRWGKLGAPPWRADPLFLRWSVRSAVRREVVLAEIMMRLRTALVCDVGHTSVTGVSHARLDVAGQDRCACAMTIHLPVRWPLALLVAALAASLLAAPAQAAQHTQRRPRAAPSCLRRGDYTVARNRVARIYETTDGADDYSYWGCLRPHGRPLRLASWFSCDCSVADESPPDVTLHGRVVTLDYLSCPPPGLGDCSSSSEQIDLRTRRPVSPAPG